MHQGRVPARTPHAQPLPDVGEAEKGGSDVEVRVLVQEIDEGLFGSLAKLREAE